MTTTMKAMMISTTISNVKSFISSTHQLKHHYFWFTHKMAHTFSESKQLMLHYTNTILDVLNDISSRPFKHIPLKIISQLDFADFVHDIDDDMFDTLIERMNWDTTGIWEVDFMEIDEEWDENLRPPPNEHIYAKCVYDKWKHLIALRTNYTIKLPEHDKEYVDDIYKTSDCAERRLCGQINIFVDESNSATTSIKNMCTALKTMIESDDYTEKDIYKKMMNLIGRIESRAQSYLQLQNVITDISKICDCNALLTMYKDVFTDKRHNRKEGDCIGRYLYDISRRMWNECWYDEQKKEEYQSPSDFDDYLDEGESNLDYMQYDKCDECDECDNDEWIALLKEDGFCDSDDNDF